MLCFDIRSLASKAASVDGRLGADDPVWEEGDPLPVDAIQVTGRLSPAGSDRFFFSGSLHGEIATTCRRCVIDLVVPVKETDIQLIFVDPGADEADDPDVHRLDPRDNDLDLRRAIREQWLLAVPAFAQCREECRGLCPTCGADLNAGPCTCAPATTDSRWDALRALRNELP